MVGLILMSPSTSAVSFSRLLATRKLFKIKLWDV